ncbi:MAG: 4-(cytidine 5'-diphospho)-2-C-methyl-D-erythritol kinase [Dehalococcoidia bacterium]|nr:4-(cytidine 5'-diphospho)-2-C-methyl-D-erythritol kinase [Dehalococcoidia bacterium]
MIIFQAYAKVNLTLEVLGERTDGYHDVATVLQPVDLSDTLTFEPALSLSLECSLPELPMEANLVYRAARLLQEETGQKAGARIRLEKGIPVAAGLGGGSSDAAATLRGLNQLWGLGLEASQLHELAARLGSDVPFFLYGGTALVEGRGERLTPLPTPQGDLGVVLLHPPITLANKTAALYRALPHNAYTRGEATGALAHCLRDGKPLKAEALFNAFAAVAFTSFPCLEHYWSVFEEAGAQGVHLAGTGPTLYILAPWAEGQDIERRLLGQGFEVYLVKMVELQASLSVSRGLLH